jgi:AraC-like DNA-binding protein
VVWCAGTTLSGTTVWGALDDRDAEALVELWDYLLPLDGVDTVIDCSRLRAAPPGGFARVAGYLARHAEAYAAKVRRQVIVPPPRAAIGALVAGLPIVLPFQHEWRAFTSLDAGLAWLDRADAAAAGAEVEAVVAEAIAAGGMLVDLRARLRADPLTGSLSALSRGVGQSRRSVQRALAAAGTTFRDELTQARAEAASELLAGTELKLDAVARAVGYASSSHFSAMFRRMTGVAPLEFRRRRR